MDDGSEQIAKNLFLYRNIQHSERYTRIYTLHSIDIDTSLLLPDFDDQRPNTMTQS